MTRQAGSAPAAAKAAESRVVMSTLNALSRSGRFRTMTATAPLRSTNTLSLIGMPSGDHARGVAARAMLDFRKLARQSDEVGERGLRVLPEIAGRRLVFFDIDADRRADGAGAGKPVDDARAAREQDADSLALRVGAVDGVVIGKIVGGFDDPDDERMAGQRRQPRPQRVHQRIAGGEIDFVVIMACVVVAAIAPPMLARQFRDRDFALGKDV